ncbi:MAG: hypothetical protein M1816_006856 [Peltula sp. TS41687]|nr:MAG: hypothetical protein M1816_006856 [Peltula sp. TS41687]
METVNPHRMSSAEIQNELDLYKTLLESLRYTPEYANPSPRQEFQARIDELRSQLWRVQNPVRNRSEDRESQSQSHGQIPKRNETQASVPFHDHNNNNNKNREGVTRPQAYKNFLPSSTSSSSSSFSHTPFRSLNHHNPAVNKSDPFYGLGVGDLSNTTADSNTVWGIASDSSPSRTSESERDSFSFLTAMDQAQGSASDTSGQMPLRKRQRESTGSHGAVNPHDVKTLCVMVPPSPQLTGPATPATISSIDMTAEELELAKAIIPDAPEGDTKTILKNMRREERKARERLEQEQRDEEFARQLNDDLDRTSQRSTATVQGNRIPLWSGPSMSGETQASTRSVFNPVFARAASRNYLPDPEPPILGSVSDQLDPESGPSSSRMPGAWMDLYDEQDKDKETGDTGVPVMQPYQQTYHYDPFSLGYAQSTAPVHLTYSPIPSPYLVGFPSSSTAMVNSSHYTPSLDPFADGPSNDFTPMYGSGLTGGPTGIMNNNLHPMYTHGFTTVNTPASLIQPQPSIVGPQPRLSSGLTNPQGLPGVNASLGLPSAVANPYRPYGFPTVPGPVYSDHVPTERIKSREEIQSLLENIRPDIELPPGNREGTPEAMKYPLMEHQKLGLTWLKSMEDGSNKGGILADDMGLGKTIQALALMVSRPSKDLRRKTTLIVAPVALLKQWEQEIKTKIKSTHKLTVHILHGTGRGAKWSDLKEFDVVLTTFGTLASELRKKEKAKPPNSPNLPLLGPDSKWYRVIIDEAQCIKNRTTKGAQAACSLVSVMRFCLTGTPMMNTVAELHSLIEFLRIKPYNEVRRFNEDFTIPLKGRHEASYSHAMRKLQALLKAVLLRRTKKSKIDGNPIIQLPARENRVEIVEFDDKQLALYTAVESKTRLLFRNFLSQGTVGSNYSNVLTLLLRLRQCCLHPSLIRVFAQDALGISGLPSNEMVKIAKELAPDVVARIKGLDGFDCPVCYDAIPNPAIFLPCGHSTCSECFVQISSQTGIQGLENGHEDAGGEVKCPQCRGKIMVKKVIDYHTFKKVHGGLDGLTSGMVDIEEPAGENSEESDDDDDDDDDSSTDDDDVMDRFVQYDEDSDGEAEYADGKSQLGQHKEGENKDGESSSKGPLKKKKDVKGKGKAKEPSKSLAQLKKEGQRNATARRTYMKRLAKDWVSSAKVDRCCAILQKILTDSPHEKAIIFSQFTSLLDLLEVPISRNKWGFKRYDGSMTANQRNDAVIEFSDPDNHSCRIMLVSLKAGNAGLNLVAASQVIMLDPFWNPFIEEQAIDRTHRIGQQRPVTVYRILVKGTVEDRIIELQEKKKGLIDGALDEKASQKIGRLGTQELAFLFGVGAA